MDGLGTFGQIATQSIYDYNKGRLAKYYTANDFSSQFGKRVHDCVGLIKGYLWSDSPDATPKYCAEPYTIDHSADSMQAACKTGGTIATLPETPGALVFSAEHVGVYIGNGKVIEARGHAYGVVETSLKDRPWTNWGLCPYIEYEAEQEDDDMEVKRFEELWLEMRQSLKDNDASQYSQDARDWAVNNGLIQGGSESEFNGMWEDILTREQFITVLYRFSQLMGKV